MAAIDTTLVREQAYHRVDRRDPDGQWELHNGHLRAKPGMTFAPNHLAFRLAVLLDRQLNRTEFVAGQNGGRVRRGATNVSIPDVFVAPIARAKSLRVRDDLLEVYSDPLPLVVDVWSPSTGAYDVNEKLAGCQPRGDLETWRRHPYGRTMTAWRRQLDGSYQETVFTRGMVQPMTFPG